jgi:hypothetical protein
MAAGEARIARKTANELFVIPRSPAFSADTRFTGRGKML